MLKPVTIAIACIAIMTMRTSLRADDSVSQASCCATAQHVYWTFGCGSPHPGHTVRCVVTVMRWNTQQSGSPAEYDSTHALGYSDSGDMADDAQASTQVSLSYGNFQNLIGSNNDYYLDDSFTHTTLNGWYQWE